MMHAALVFFLAASVARAQSEMRPNQSASKAANFLATEFVPDCANNPYSQLATFMNCNDCSSNLWNNYSSQRAALAAHRSRHGDGQCCCSDRKNCSHGQATEPCGCHGCRTEGKGGHDVPLNRYAASTNRNQDGSPACKPSCDPNPSGGCWTFSSLYKTPTPNGASSVVASCVEKGPCGKVGAIETASNSSGSKLGVDKSLITFSLLHVSPAPSSGTPCMK